MFDQLAGTTSQGTDIGFDPRTATPTTANWSASIPAGVEGNVLLEIRSDAPPNADKVRTPSMLSMPNTTASILLFDVPP